MAKDIKEILNEINEEILKQESTLTDLDNKIGDGDHGLNMKRGFSFVLEAIATEKPSGTKETLTLVGKTLMSKVGGASGPLYGMAFIKGAMNIKNNVWNLTSFKEFVNGATIAIETLGKVKLDDKTMFDVWKRLSNDIDKDVSGDKIIENLKINRDDTKDKKALKGRASFLKERSKGTIDPGCASSEIILRHLIQGA